MRGKKGVSAPFPGDAADPRGFHALAEAFCEAQLVAGLEATTVRTYRRNLGYFVAWALERELARPQAATRAHVERYQAHLHHHQKANGQPLSYAVQHQRLLAVQVFFRWLARHNLVLFNPAADIEMPKVRRELPKDVLSAAEAETILAQPDLTHPIGLRDRAILEVLYSSGIRRTEASRLTLYDIDRERGTLIVRLGKGRKDRVVPVGARAVAWIDRYIADARPLFATTPDAGRLFLSPAGAPMHPDHLTRLGGKYRKAAGVAKKGSCHIFRHTAATLMLENGADVRLIQEMLGHASLATTQIYTRVSIRRLKEVHQATHPGAALEKKTSDNSIEGLEETNTDRENS